MLQEEIAERQSAKPVPSKRVQNVNFDKSDLTQFLQKRILDYERKQQSAQNQLDEILGEYQKLIDKINQQKNKYKSIVLLLSNFIDQLITLDPALVSDNGKPQVDIHLDLDLIKGADNLESDLDNKSLLALALVLLKQVQPFVADYEAQESKF